MSPDPIPAPQASSQSRNMATLAHLSSMVCFLGIPSFLGPLVFWLIQRDRDAFAAESAREALNFNLSVLIYLAIGLALSIATLGIGFLVFLPALLIGFFFWLVLTVIAAVRSSNGETYRYPLTIRLVN